MRTLLLAVAWLAGISALAAGSGALQVAAGAGVVAACLAAYRDRRGVLLALAALPVLLLAWLRWEAVNAPPPPDSVAWLADGERRALSGRVASEPETRGASQRLTVTVDAVEEGGAVRAASGRVQVRVAPSVRLRFGDRLRLDGPLEPPPVLRGFDYPRYLARREVFAVMEYPRLRVTGRSEDGGAAGPLRRLRERAHEAFWRNLPAQEASLAEGMLIGRRSEIPPEVNESFQRSGASHLIVISGFNIALVAGMVIAAAGWVTGRRWAALIALAAVALYSVLVGLTPPVARAAVMAGVASLALLSGRPQGGGVTLLLAAALLTIPDPRVIEEVSFQLSVAATAGLILLAPPMLSLGRRLIHEERPVFAITWRSVALAAWDILAVTLAATVATLPILLASFGRLSLVSPLTNLILVPLFPLVILLGAAGLAVALLVPALAATALAPVGALLGFSIAVTKVMAALPGSSLGVGWFTPTIAALTYLLLGVAVYLRRPGRVRPEDSVAWHVPTPLLARPLPLLAFAPAAILLLMSGSMLVAGLGRDGRSSVTALGLPDRAAALVRLPGGTAILVDTGAAPRGARNALDRELRGGAALAAVVVTEDAPSARGGLAEVIDRWRPPLLLVPPGAEDAAWLERARETGARVVPLRPGLTLGGRDAALHVDGLSDGRWTLSLRHDERTIAIGSTAGDASLTRASRATVLSAHDGHSRVTLTLERNEAASLQTDGRSVRLAPPPGRELTLTRCSPGCSGEHRQ